MARDCQAILRWREASGLDRAARVAVLAVLVLSLVLRVLNLDAFLAGDESKWFCRSLNFRNALVTGNLRETCQSEHPGVVTMWLGTAATSLGEAGPWVDYCLDMGGNKLTRVDSNAELLRLPGLIGRGRLAIALFTWCGIVVAWLVLRRLVGELASACAIVLLALDPFYLALSRVMHLDAVLSTLMLLSLLLLLLYARDRQSRLHLVLSAVMGGLAVAQKSPGGFMAIAATAVLLPRWQGTGEWQTKRRASDWVLWGAVAAATLFVVWPALWVAPFESLGLVVRSAVGYAEAPHGNSNFFWFAIRPDPGPFFYPVAWAFRTTPVVILGLLGLAFGREREGQRWSRLVLLGFALVYALFMTTGAKKFDRYLLPLFLPIDILAGIGLARLLGGSLERVGGKAASPTVQRVGALVLALGLQVLPLLSKAPYYFSYYNPLLGGAETAQNVLLTGWGEGMEEAAAYLNQKPYADQFHVNTAHIAQFAPFFVGHTSSASDLDLAESDYYVFYVNTIQRLREPQVLLKFLGVHEPEMVIRADGIDYVWIYANTLTDPAVEYVAQHGDTNDDVLIVDVNASLVRHYDGDIPLVRVDGAWGEDAILDGLASATTGRTRVWHLSFDETPGDPRQLVAQRLGEQGSLVSTVTFEGMQLRAYELADDAAFLPVVPPARLEARLGQDILLRGYALSASGEGAGLELDLYWRAEASVHESYTVFVHLLDDNGKLIAQHDAIPGGALATDVWRVNETVVDSHRLSMTEETDLATCRIMVGMYLLETGERPPVLVDGVDQPDRAVVLSNLDVAASLGRAGGSQ